MFRKKKKIPTFTAQEMIDRLQKHGLKGDGVTWREVLTMFGLGALIILVAVALMALGT